LGIAERLEAEVQVNDPAVIVAAEGRSIVVLWRRPIAVPVLAVISTVLMSTVLISAVLMSTVLMSAVLMPPVVPATMRTLISTVSLMSAVVATGVPLVTMP
jgi:hypothetical protein